MSASRRALSLVEALLALVLLGIAYLPLSQVFHFTAQQTVQSRNHLVAQHLASNLFELFRLKQDVFIVGAKVQKGKVADVLATARGRSLLTGDAKEIEDTLQLGKTTLELAYEFGVENNTGIVLLEVTVRWEEDRSPRSATYARIVAF